LIFPLPKSARSALSAQNIAPKSKCSLMGRRSVPNLEKASPNVICARITKVWTSLRGQVERGNSETRFMGSLLVLGKASAQIL